MALTRIDSSLAISFFAFAVAVNACSAAPTIPVEEGDDSTEGKESSAGAKKDAGANNTSSGTTTKDGGTSNEPEPEPEDPTDPTMPTDCSSESSADACYACCEAIDPTGIDAAYQAFDACICDNPGTCAQQCGSSYCAGQAPSAACEACLDADTQCTQAADQVCAASPGCEDVFTCYDTSACDTK